MIENQKDSEDATDIVRTIKSDLAPEEVFRLYPKGRCHQSADGCHSH